MSMTWRMNERSLTNVNIIQGNVRSVNAQGPAGVVRACTPGIELIGERHR
jgi:hypothetical protein